MRLPFRFASVSGFALIFDQGDLPPICLAGEWAEQPRKLMAAQRTPITTRSPNAAHAVESPTAELRLGAMLLPIQLSLGP
jgi:hypothetical protein